MENKIIGKLVRASVLVATVTAASGCWQITGIDRLKMGTWEIVGNKGFEVSAGAMQYDAAKNLKGMSSEVERINATKGGSN